MSDADKILTSIGNASRTLSMLAGLSVKKGMFGKSKPTEKQLAWSFGFCDGFAQSLGLNKDADFIFFISTVFENVFGKDGISYFKKVALNQDRYANDIVAGGTSHHSWTQSGRTPLMPL